MRLPVATFACASVGALLGGCQTIYGFEKQAAHTVAAEDLSVGPPPSAATATHVVPAAGESLSGLAAGISGDLNRSPGFSGLGVAAKVTSPATASTQTVQLTYPDWLPITLSAVVAPASNTSAGEQVAVSMPSKGVALLSVTGAPAPNDVLTVVGSIGMKEALGTVINQSEGKCKAFLDSVVTLQTGSNTSLDVLSTVTSALGTAFKPVSTIHAMTAATSIFTGSKTAIDADVYAKASISNFSSAIEATYYADMGKYVDDLGSSDASSLVWSLEVFKIRSIHRECSLASAEATIAKTLQAPPAQQPAAQQAATQPSSVKVDVTAANTTLNTLASNLSDAINASPDLKTAKVTAAATAAVITVTYGGPSYDWKLQVDTAAGAPGAEKLDSKAGSKSTVLTLSGTVAAGDKVSLIATPTPVTTPATAAPAPAPVQSPVASSSTTSGNGQPAAAQQTNPAAKNGVMTKSVVPGSSLTAPKS